MNEYLTTAVMSTAEPLRKTATVEEAAQMLGIGRSAAYRLVRTGELRSVRIGRRFVIPLSAIDELLNPNSNKK